MAKLKSAKKPKKKKTITYKKAKADAWNAFSKYVRQRDMEQGCFTCGRRYEFKKMQAGHWVPGRHISVLFDPRNVHAQCFYCNLQLKGNPIVYYDKMLETYGKEVCEELKKLDKAIVKYKVVDLVAIKEKYEELYNQLTK